MQKLIFHIALGSCLILPVFIYGIRLLHTGCEITDPDAMRFLHQARLISEKGVMPERDLMRSSPIGKPTSYQLTLLPYLVAYTHKSISWLGLNVTLEQVDLLQPIVFLVMSLTIFYMTKHKF